MGSFQHFLAIDWSGAKGPRQKGIALAIADAAGGPPVLIDAGRGWSREEVLHLLLHALPPNTLVGMDLGIALPFVDAGTYFPDWADSPKDAKSLWGFIDEICADDPNLEASSFVAHPEASRYFRHSKEHVGDRFLLPNAVSREGRFRAAELAQRAAGVRPVSNFNLVGAAQVGKSSLTGMRLLNRLGGAIPVWPIDPLPATGSVIAEIYTAFAARAAGSDSALGKGTTKFRSYETMNDGLSALGSPTVVGKGGIDDHSSDALITAAWLRKAANHTPNWLPKGLTNKIAATEGWTFGAV